MIESATGAGALASNTTGANNTGVDALPMNTVGANNTATSAHALFANTTESNDIAIGLRAALSVWGGNSNNIHIGTHGGAADSSTIRIGGNASFMDPAVQTSSFVAGVRGVTTPNNDAVPVRLGNDRPHISTA